ncbi:MAG: AbrB/MazE/SpoVT family DNA-binding domain-containing protein [Candidatus Altiarchaeales archaeon]|nr:AbrB/MazE/SpoVT family DNA-binding domain-containing protein [Candidatus Altiarchaeales archaeon]
MEMINVDVTKLSSKGQIVIPQDMREEFSVGDKFVIIKDDHQLILKPLQDLGKNFMEDLKFAKRTVEALGKYEKGKFKEASSKDFLVELEKW